MAKQQKPKLDINGEQVEKLAMLGCTVVDIAFILDCSTDTLHRRFAAELDKGRAKKRTKLRQLMWQSAEKGSVAMQIFLSKQYLGFSDKIETNQGELECVPDTTIRDLVKIARQE